MEKYLKECKDGKVTWRFKEGFNKQPGREVETTDWGIGDYVDYCLFPLKDCIQRMDQAAEDRDDDIMREFANILRRLYDSAIMQLEKMDDAIYKDMGWIKIRQVNEKILGDFLQQELLEVFVEKEEARRMDA